ncbi:MAG: DinB family protein [Capsulimonadales bacterium]|nr:DinB family protein [Capsulimonadales bacterium]
MRETIIPERVRIYAIQAMTGTPKVLARLLHDIRASEADGRPDPARFTIREAVAHLADWEPIWLGRFRAIIEEDRPFLPGYDEGQFAVDRNYADSDPVEQAMRFAEGRAALASYVANVPLEDWNRVGFHGEMGEITFGSLVTLLLAHDGYHLKQVVEFRYESIEMR